jgi:hypothetical protein
LELAVANDAVLHEPHPIPVVVEEQPRMHSAPAVVGEWVSFDSIDLLPQYLTF